MPLHHTDCSGTEPHWWFPCLASWTKQGTDPHGSAPLPSSSQSPCHKCHTHTEMQPLHQGPWKLQACILIKSSLKKPNKHTPNTHQLYIYFTGYKRECSFPYGSRRFSNIQTIPRKSQSQVQISWKKPYSSKSVCAEQPPHKHTLLSTAGSKHPCQAGSWKPDDHNACPALLLASRATLTSLWSLFLHQLKAVLDWAESDRLGRWNCHVSS